MQAAAKRGAQQKEQKAAAEAGEELFCLCRRPYHPGQFMIGCDVCTDWFHLECVGISKLDVDSIKDYVCPNCKAAQNAKKAKASKRPGPKPGKKQKPVAARVPGPNGAALDDNKRRPRVGGTNDTPSKRIKVTVNGEAKSDGVRSARSLYDHSDEDDEDEYDSYDDDSGIEIDFDIYEDELFGIMGEYDDEDEFGSDGEKKVPADNNDIYLTSDDEEDNNFFTFDRLVDSKPPAASPSASDGPIDSAGGPAETDHAEPDTPLPGRAASPLDRSIPAEATVIPPALEPAGAASSSSSSPSAPSSALKVEAKEEATATDAPAAEDGPHQDGEDVVKDGEEHLPTEGAVVKSQKAEAMDEDDDHVVGNGASATVPLEATAEPVEANESGDVEMAAEDKKAGSNSGMALRSKKVADPNRRKAQRPYFINIDIEAYIDSDLGLNLTDLPAHQPEKEQALLKHMSRTRHEVLLNLLQIEVEDVDRLRAMEYAQRESAVRLLKDPVDDKTVWQKSEEQTVRLLNGESVMQNPRRWLEKMMCPACEGLVDPADFTHHLKDCAIQAGNTARYTEPSYTLVSKPQPLVTHKSGVCGCPLYSVTIRKSFMNDIISPSSSSSSSSSSSPSTDSPTLILKSDPPSRRYCQNLRDRCAAHLFWESLWDAEITQHRKVLCRRLGAIETEMLMHLQNIKERESAEAKDQEMLQLMRAEQALARQEAEERRRMTIPPRSDLQQMYQAAAAVPPAANVGSPTAAAPGVTGAAGESSAAPALAPLETALLQRLAARAAELGMTLEQYAATCPQEYSAAVQHFQAMNEYMLQQMFVQQQQHQLQQLLVQQHLQHQHLQHLQASQLLAHQAAAAGLHDPASLSSLAALQLARGAQSAHGGPEDLTAAAEHAAEQPSGAAAAEMDGDVHAGADGSLSEDVGHGQQTAARPSSPDRRALPLPSRSAAAPVAAARVLAQADRDNSRLSDVSSSGSSADTNSALVAAAAASASAPTTDTQTAIAV